MKKVQFMTLGIRKTKMTTLDLCAYSSGKVPRHAVSIDVLWASSRLSPLLTSAET